MQPRFDSGYRRLPASAAALGALRCSSMSCWPRCWAFCWKILAVSSRCLASAASPMSGPSNALVNPVSEKSIGTVLASPVVNWISSVPPFFRAVTKSAVTSAWAMHTTRWLFGADRQADHVMRGGLLVAVDADRNAGREDEAGRHGDADAELLRIGASSAARRWQGRRDRTRRHSPWSPRRRRMLRIADLEPLRYVAARRRTLRHRRDRRAHQEGCGSQGGPSVFEKFSHPIGHQGFPRFEFRVFGRGHVGPAPNCWLDGRQMRQDGVPMARINSLPAPGFPAECRRIGDPAERTRGAWPVHAAQYATLVCQHRVRSRPCRAPTRGR